MLSRPTTEQILLDCARELMTGVLPALTDETAVVRVVMIEQVLRNMAVRAAHEIAWMREEIVEIERYARTVLDAQPSPQLEAALSASTAASRDSLHLDAVVEVYCKAGDALSAALETAVAASDADLVRQGEGLLKARCEREAEVMAGWSPTGR
jgi:hypothetical protein